MKVEAVSGNGALALAGEQLVGRLDAMPARDELEEVVTEGSNQEPGPVGGQKRLTTLMFDNVAVVGTAEVGR
eukprot:15462272-Alexandrium_andersonii.AAC.1